MNHLYTSTVHRLYEVVVVPEPSPGQDWTCDLPLEHYLPAFGRLVSVEAVLTCGPQAGTRKPALKLWQTPGQPTLITMGSLSGGESALFSASLLSGEPFMFGDTQVFALPDVAVTHRTTVFTTTEGLTPTDQWTNLLLRVAPAA